MDTFVEIRGDLYSMERESHSEDEARRNAFAWLKERNLVLPGVYEENGEVETDEANDRYIVRYPHHEKYILEPSSAVHQNGPRM